MPLTMADTGIPIFIMRVHGKDAAKRMLTSLGFTPGTAVTIVSANEENLIVNVKETRIAISKAMANKIYVA